MTGILAISIPLLVFLGLSLSENVNEKQSLETVEIDQKEYMGEWYLQASSSEWFQMFCNKPKANYELNDEDRVEVTNSCNRFGFWESKTKGILIDKHPDTVGQFEVTFDGGDNYGNYYVIDVKEDNYSVVGTPDRDSYWILSRDRKFNQTKSMLEKLEEKGFDVSESKTYY